MSNTNHWRAQTEADPSKHGASDLGVDAWLSQAKKRLARAWLADHEPEDEAA